VVDPMSIGGFLPFRFGRSFVSYSYTDTYRKICRHQFLSFASTANPFRLFSFHLMKWSALCRQSINRRRVVAAIMPSRFYWLGLAFVQAKWLCWNWMTFTGG
jgi:hypothetical protein